MSGLDDRMLVERLINTCLVPFSLDTVERMKKLLLLFSTIDENASKAFIEVQKNQRQVDVLEEYHTLAFGLQMN